MTATKLEMYHVSEPFSELHLLKEQLLNLIDEADSTDITENEGTEYVPTSETTYAVQPFPRTESTIGKLDWFKSRDFENRPWVNLVRDMISSKLNSMIYKHYGLSGIAMNDLWFEQYGIGEAHGWHIHSQNFTGVYYLELPEDDDNETLILSGKKLIVPKVKEGEICLFPAFAIHSGPKINSTKRKTILSYNFDVKGISSEQYDKIEYN